MLWYVLKERCDSSLQSSHTCSSRGRISIHHLLSVAGVHGCTFCKRIAGPMWAVTDAGNL
jgi:hypothetical protein